MQTVLFLVLFAFNYNLHVGWLDVGWLVLWL